MVVVGSSVGADAGGEIGICWTITISNLSDIRASIVDYRVFNLQNGNLGVLTGFHNLENTDGSPVSLPITLNGGETKDIVVRAPVFVPAAVARIIRPEYEGHIVVPLSVGELAKTLAMSGTDFLGNNVAGQKYTDGRLVIWAIEPPFKRAPNAVRFVTARGSVVVGKLDYPYGVPE
jgi:hypothetical protein